VTSTGFRKLDAGTDAAIATSTGTSTNKSDAGIDAAKKLDAPLLTGINTNIGFTVPRSVIATAVLTSTSSAH
jgi:hypothetical protein